MSDAFAAKRESAGVSLLLLFLLLGRSFSASCHGFCAALPFFNRFRLVVSSFSWLFCAATGSAGSGATEEKNLVSLKGDRGTRGP